MELKHIEVIFSKLISSRYELDFEFLCGIGKYHDYDCDEHKARDHLKEVGLNLPLLMSWGKRGEKREDSNNTCS